MKVKFTLINFFSLLLLAFTVACSHEEPYGPNSNSNNPNYNHGNTYATPDAMFSITTKHPLTIVIDNRSRNAARYYWDFGDGNKSSDESPSHKYSSMGVYRVKLTVYNSVGDSDTYEANVTIENPSKVYFTGVTYEKLSVNNKYIKFKLVDDDFFTTTWCNSTYKLLSKANLPYDFILNTPVLMDGLDDDDYYVINVYWSNSNSGSGTKLQGFRFNTSLIYNEYPETIYWNESNGNKIRCYLKYE